MSDGPIHPVTTSMHVACVKGECCRVSEGLSKRELFAMVATLALARRNQTPVLPREAVHYADALLAELERDH